MSQVSTTHQGVDPVLTICWWYLWNKLAHQTLHEEKRWSPDVTEHWKLLASLALKSMSIDDVATILSGAFVIYTSPFCKYMLSNFGLQVLTSCTTLSYYCSTSRWCMNIMQVTSNDGLTCPILHGADLSCRITQASVSSHHKIKNFICCGNNRLR